MNKSPSIIDLYTHNALISKQVLLVVSAQSVIVVYLYTQFIFFRQITLYLAKTQLKNCSPKKMRCSVLLFKLGLTKTKKNPQENKNLYKIY